MTPSPAAGLCLLALAAAVYAAPATAPGASSPGPRQPRAYIDSVPDTGQFLPDTAVLATLNARVIRVGEFVERFFRSDAEFRPRPDSAGRVEFLNSMINKEAIAHVARQAERPESFEDRLVLREHTQRVLSNVLFQRAVLDSVHEPSEEEIRKIYSQTGYELRLQVIVMRERGQAERVRRDLVARRITWRDAVKRYSALSTDRFPDGDLGWQRRSALDPATATAVFDLVPGAISNALPQPAGSAIYRAVARRDIPLLSYQPMRSMIRDELRGLQIGERSARIFALLRARAGMVHDSANIAWAASRFTPAVTLEGGATPVFNIDAGVPHFEPEDTSRVLGRWADGQLTLGGFLAAYAATSPVGRPNVTTPEAFHNQVDVFALETYRADLARSRGLDRDSLATALIERRREELLVEHLYQDSILAQVFVSSADRRKYYRENTASFMTVPGVKYARFHAERKGEADSLAARLRAGEKAEEILKDAGRRAGSGAIEEQREDERGTPHYALLFGEIRPGQVAVEGPDAQGHFEVIQSLSFDPGRQLSYEEAEASIDESLQNLAAEKRLNAFIARHKRGLRITAHRELLMRVRLIAPTF